MPEDIHISLHPVNFVVISGILQCIIAAGILIFYKRESRLSTVSIGLVVLICSLHFAWPLVIDTNVADIFRWSFSFPYSYLLALGPLLLIYTRSLSMPGFAIRQKDLTQFIPVIIEILVQVYFIVQSIRRDELFYIVPGFMTFRVVEFVATGISIFFLWKAGTCHPHAT